MVETARDHTLSNYGHPALTGTVVLLGLYATSQYSNLLFHNLVELAGILVAFLIFTLVWNTRRVLDNQYLLFIGIALLFSGLLELVHTYAYNNIGILKDSSVDLVTQLWIAYRYLFSISFLLAPFFINRRTNAEIILSGYLVITFMLIGAIFSGWFPACYSENTGMTLFKIISEYVVSFILLVSLWLLYLKRAAFDRGVFRLLRWSILASIVSALSYTQYVIVINTANIAGHIFELLADYLIYRAVVVTGIANPANILFRNLKMSEEKLRDSEERYRSLIELSPDAIVVHCEGKFVYVNGAGVKLFGAADAKELIGRNVLDMVHPDDRDMVQERIRQSYEQKIHAPTRDIKMLRIDGQTVYVEVTTSPTLYTCKPATQAVIRDITERKEAEKRIEHLASFPKLNPNPVIEVDAQGKITYYNDAAISVLKRLSGEDDVRVLLPGDMADLLKNLYQENAAQIAYREVEIQNAVFAETVYLSKALNVARIYAIDISERKLAEEALHIKDNAIATSINGIAFADLQGNLTYVNKAFLSMWGYEETEDVLGKPASDFWQSSDDALQIIEMLGRTGQWYGEMDAVKRGGTPFSVQISASMVKNEKGERVCMMASFNDITERKRAEEAMRKAHDELEIRVQERTAQLANTNRELQEEMAIRMQAELEHARLVSAVESTAEAVVITNPTTGFIQYVNPAFERMTGYSKGEMLGRTIHFLESGKHDELYYQGLQEALQRDGVWSGNLVNKKKDGTLYFEECTVSPVRNRDNEIINYVYIKRDVTEKLRLESIAESVNTMDNIGFIFSGVRHEIGNPINSMNMILGILRAKLDTLSGEAVRDYLGRMSDQVARVEYILRSLKSFNLYETQQPRNVQISSFIENFLLLIRDDFEKKGIVIETSIDHVVRSVYADPRALQQVFLNVFTNAMDAVNGRHDPKISIIVQGSDGVVRISVQDNGIGIPEENLKNLFKPFYTTKEQGSGLGLVIVRKMLANMSGTIDIESRKDTGTVVNISIPEGTE